MLFWQLAIIIIIIIINIYFSLFSGKGQIPKLIALKIHESSESDT